MSTFSETYLDGVFGLHAVWRDGYLSRAARAIPQGRYFYSSDDTEVTTLSINGTQIDVVGFNTNHSFDLNIAPDDEAPEPWRFLHVTTWTREKIFLKLREIADGILVDECNPMD